MSRLSKRDANNRVDDNDREGDNDDDDDVHKKRKMRMYADDYEEDKLKRKK